MKFRTAIALLALAAPVFAQHGGHGGFAGGRGAGGHAGSGSRGFTRSFASPAPQFRYGSPSFRYNLPATRYGSMGRLGFRGAVPQRYSGFRSPYNTSSQIPYNGNRFGAGRAPYRRGGADGRGGDWNRGGDHDRFDRRRRDFNNWYNYNYPYGLGYGYPYIFDPGFYDWGDFDTGDNEQPSYDQGGYGYDQGGYGYDQGGYGYDQSGAPPDYQAPNPYQSRGPLILNPAVPAPGSAAGYGPPDRQSAQSSAGFPTALPNQPLTVVFKNGRDPIKMQNYMLTADVLTDLDPQHYAEIPLNQIDLAATQWANSAVGGSFQVPGTAHD